MDIIYWMLIGLIAGVGAALVFGSAGYGLVGDMVVGMLGAVLGGALFRNQHWSSPTPGLAGTVIIALIGASLLLIALRVVKRYST